MKFIKDDWNNILCVYGALKYSLCAYGALKYSNTMNLYVFERFITRRRMDCMHSSIKVGAYAYNTFIYAPLER